MLALPMGVLLKSKLASYFALFASAGTLLCCALPSLLVSIGIGAVMAGLVTTLPQLIWLSQYKAYVFSGSGLMISIAAYFQYRSRFEPCPADPLLAKACDSARRLSSRILILSASIWCIGSFFAFVAPKVLN